MELKKQKDKISRLEIVDAQLKKSSGGDQFNYAETSNFNDDEPPLPAKPASWPNPTLDKISIIAKPQSSEIAASESRSSFCVDLCISAPPPLNVAETNPKRNNNGDGCSLYAQDVRVVVSASHGVEIRCLIPYDQPYDSRKRMPNEIILDKQGIIHVGDLLHSESHDVWVFVSVPVHSFVTDETIGKTPLLDIVCYYRNVVTNERVQIHCPRIEIARTINYPGGNRARGLGIWDWFCGWGFIKSCDSSTAK